MAHRWESWIWTSTFPPMCSAHVWGMNEWKKWMNECTPAEDEQLGNLLCAYLWIIIALWNPSHISLVRLLTAGYCPTFLLLGKGQLPENNTDGWVTARFSLNENKSPGARTGVGGGGGDGERGMSGQNRLLTTLGSHHPEADHPPTCSCPPQAQIQHPGWGIALALACDLRMPLVTQALLFSLRRILSAPRSSLAVLLGVTSERGFPAALAPNR